MADRLDRIHGTQRTTTLGEDVHLSILSIEIHDHLKPHLEEDKNGTLVQKSR